eukprot:253821_1
MEPLQILLLLALFIVSEDYPEWFRESWSLRDPLIDPYAIAMNNELDFIRLTRWEITTFIDLWVQPLDHILNRTDKQIKKWIFDNDYHAIYHAKRKGPPKRLDTANRLMRYFMFCSGCKIPTLELLFGQRKSEIYEDSFLISMVIVKKWKITLPDKESEEYRRRVGSGTFAGVFDLAVYAMDGHQVSVCKPSYQQREFYDGRVKTHCVNYLYLHESDGTAAYVSKGKPGRKNDINLLNTSSFYLQIDRYIDIARGHGILCDGIWRHEAAPFITRFCERDDLSIGEIIFNYYQSEKRVIAENYYGRLHKLWDILKTFALANSKLDIFVHALSIATNKHIRFQSPLRND